MGVIIIYDYYGRLFSYDHHNQTLLTENYMGEPLFVYGELKEDVRNYGEIVGIYF